MIELTEKAKARIKSAYDVSRLIADVEQLYGKLLQRKPKLHGSIRSHNQRGTV